MSDGGQMIVHSACRRPLVPKGDGHYCQECQRWVPLVEVWIANGEEPPDRLAQESPEGDR